MKEKYYADYEHKYNVLLKDIEKEVKKKKILRSNLNHVLDFFNNYTTRKGALLKLSTKEAVLRDVREFMRLCPKTDFKKLLKSPATVKKILDKISKQVCKKTGKPRSPGSLDNVKKNIKLVFKYLNNDKLPKSVDNRYFKTSIHANTLTSDDMLDEIDILKMVEARQSVRDKALIFCLFESLCRSLEFWRWSISDIKLFKNYAEVKVYSAKKEENRKIILVRSLPLLISWLNSHPDRSNPSAPVWITGKKYAMPNKKFHKSKEANMEYRRLSKPQMQQILNQAAEKAGIKKPVNFHNFRRSGSSFLENILGMNRGIIETQGGWERNSNVLGRYIKIGDKHVKEEFLDKNKVNVDEKPVANPILCSCGFLNQPQLNKDKKNIQSPDFCLKCGNPISITGLKDAEKLQMLKIANLVKESIQKDKKIEALSKGEPLKLLTVGELEKFNVTDSFTNPDINNAELIQSISGAQFNVNNAPVGFLPEEDWIKCEKHGLYYNSQNPCKKCQKEKKGYQEIK